MKLINQKVEEWHCGYTLPEIWSHIAKCARVCYQSEPRNNGETDEEFVKRVILRNHSLKEIGENRELQLKLHLSCLEHGTVYLDIPAKNVNDCMYDFYNENPYSDIYNYSHDNVAISTNMRVIVENGGLKDLKYICAPTEHHTIRTTFNIITDIGVARELARHRTHSISEESTRYCNYSKDKFNNEISFIMPEWCDEHRCNAIDVHYFEGFRDIEEIYFRLIKDGLTAQQARQILPLSTKVQTIHTAFDIDWFEFIELRADACSGSVHPNMKVIANKIKSLMSKENATL